MIGLIIAIVYLFIWLMKIGERLPVGASFCVILVLVEIGAILLTVFGDPGINKKIYKNYSKKLLDTQQLNLLDSSDEGENTVNPIFKEELEKIKN